MEYLIRFNWSFSSHTHTSAVLIAHLVCAPSLNREREREKRQQRVSFVLSTHWLNWREVVSFEKRNFLNYKTCKCPLSKRKRFTLKWLSRRGSERAKERQNNNCYVRIVLEPLKITLIINAGAMQTARTRDCVYTRSCFSIYFKRFLFSPLLRLLSF